MPTSCSRGKYASKERQTKKFNEDRGRTLTQYRSGLPLPERSVPGLHDALITQVSTLPVGRALDIGAGTGAWARRLANLGFDVTCADIDVAQFKLELPILRVNLDEEAGRARLVSEGPFDFVSAVEVIEHVRGPIDFLQMIRGLLKPEGVALITTPNMDSLPARVKYLLKGKLRLMDEFGDATHVSPIFWDLLTRQYLPAANLELADFSVYPADGFVAGRTVYRRVAGWARLLLGSNPRLVGDNLVLVLRRRKDSVRY